MRNTKILAFLIGIAGLTMSCMGNLNVKAEELPPTSNESLDYNIGAIDNSLKTYSYDENPYYLEGLERYASGLNEIYESVGGNQKVEIQNLEEALKEASVSNSMIKKILDAEGENVLTNQDFKRMEIKKDSKIFFSKGDYYEVSSKAKDEFNEFDDLTVLYYFGALDDNRPDGEGALFILTDSGIRLLCAGDFKEGRLNGKGVCFNTDSYAATLWISGTFKDGSQNGKCIVYNSVDVQQIYWLYRANWSEYEEYYYNQYNNDEKNQMLKYLFENDSTAELMYITQKYEVTDVDMYFDVRVQYPVIKPVISYEGNYTKNVYSGKGTLYGSLGTLWYQGEFKNGVYSGKGKLYYPLIEAVQYDGEFRGGEMKGKGTLYNTDGTVRKKGKFDGEEIDYADTIMESRGIYDEILEKSEEVGIQAFFEKDRLIYKEESDYLGYDSEDYMEDEEISHDGSIIPTDLPCFPIMSRGYEDAICPVMVQNEENGELVSGTYEEMLESCVDDGITMFAPPMYYDGYIYTATKWDAYPDEWSDDLLTYDEFIDEVNRLADI